MKTTLCTLLMIHLLGCGGKSYEYVRFETTQPEGVKESGSFNKKLKGEYISCSNPDDRIIISDKMILNFEKFNFKAHRNELEFDSTVSVNINNNDELKKFLKDEGFETEISGDTINLFHTNTDTIFLISESQVLKTFKGSYFLNFKRDENFWDVMRMDTHKDSLFMGQIVPSDTLLQFDFAMKREEFNGTDSTTTTRYSMKPSRKEFKKLMKPNYFDRVKCYCKKK